MGTKPRRDPAISLETPWLKQGDVFTNVTQLPALDDCGKTTMTATPEGVVVISQTCDAIRSPVVQVSPVVSLQGQELSLAASGRSPRYAPLPSAGANLFARLDTVATISKVLLRESERTAGVETLIAIRALAHAIGRRYSRFAFPDEVAAWFKPLQELAQKKATRQDSAEGKALARVRQIRIRADSGWDAPPFILGITFILDEGELPFDNGRPSPELVDWLSDRPSAEIAARLMEAVSAEQTMLFQSLAESWVARCAATGGGAVADYSVDIATADEYPLSAYYDSEALDLDHLSGNNN